ncbi:MULTISPECIES: hypothetical protein [Chryseobacterium]|uniref:Uncharacterized protein n=2 Tax=Chryseobacterium TaxID=59732 RepID=A0ABU1LFL3_9FLAO|nr:MULTISPECIES: hypothetical protein [Chryseobacterium]MDR6405508.1 hypothetical protein [Chryseobacterium geocarposphaerae]MDR6698739.1 hypothetical protein [Chryseobacterium ginsenosidimutans]
MNCRNIVKMLKSDHFTKIKNKGNWFEEDSTIYAKEIKENVYLLFVILKDLQIESMRALIAHFDDIESIGTREPQQIMFYLSIKNKEDLHYFEKYLKPTEKELITF